MLNFNFLEGKERGGTFYWHPFCAHAGLHPCAFVNCRRGNEAFTWTNFLLLVFFISFVLKLTCQRVAQCQHSCPFLPSPKNAHNSVNPGSTWQQTLAWLIFFFPSQIDRITWLLIYLLINDLYPVFFQKDLSASLDVLASAPCKHLKEENKLLEKWCLVSLQNYELPEKTSNEPITAENE